MTPLNHRKRGARKGASSYYTRVVEAITAFGEKCLCVLTLGKAAGAVAACLLFLVPAPAKAIAVQEPCGYVDFVPFALGHTDASGQVMEHISIVVHFPDGTKQSVDLDYPFVYPNRDVDPFLPWNAKIPAVFQFPPADRRSTEPPLVQYVMAHTTPEGYTRLKVCP